jgi:nicotinamidase-related amidase
VSRYRYVEGSTPTITYLEESLCTLGISTLLESVLTRPTFSPNTPGWNIHTAIAPMDGDVIIQKRTPDSFHNTNLQDELKKLGIQRLVLAGIQTDMCVDTTCRRAFSLGYDVVLAKDAHSTWDSKHLTADQIIEHHNNVLKWFADTAESADIVF